MIYERHTLRELKKECNLIKIRLEGMRHSKIKKKWYD